MAQSILGPHRGFSEWKNVKFGYTVEWKPMNKATPGKKIGEDNFYEQNINLMKDFKLVCEELINKKPEVKIASFKPNLNVLNKSKHLNLLRQKIADQKENIKILENKIPTIPPRYHAILRNTQRKLAIAKNNLNRLINNESVLVKKLLESQTKNVTETKITIKKDKNKQLPLSDDSIENANISDVDDSQHSEQNVDDSQHSQHSDHLNDIETEDIDDDVRDNEQNDHDVDDSQHSDQNSQHSEQNVEDTQDIKQLKQLIQISSESLAAARATKDTVNMAKFRETINKCEAMLERAEQENLRNRKYKLWPLLQKLAWPNSDERTATKHMLRKFDINELKFMFAKMKELAIPLAESINEHTGTLRAMNEEQRNNFLFHIIAAGEQMYSQSLVEPDFCMYLCDVYQPLYTMLREIVG